MNDFSLWESGHKSRIMGDFGLSLGRIVDVDAKNRTCSVVTFGGKFPQTDQYVSKCQWLTTDSSPDGDESGCIPRRGSVGLVFFVQGEPFVWGFLRPLSKGGSAAAPGETPTLNEGDKILSTKKGNRITIKISGLIEQFVSSTLQRVMFPIGSRILDICRTYILKTDGGGIQWGPTDADGITVIHEAQYNNTVSRTITLKESRGYVSSDVIYRAEIGPGNLAAFGASTPTYVHTIKSTGEKVLEIHPPLPEGSPAGFKSTIGPDGSISIVAGSAQTVKFDVDSLGETKLSVNELSEASFSKTGDIAIKNKVGEATVSAAGDIAVKNNMAKLTMSATGDIELATGATKITIGVSGEIKIDTPNKATISSKAGFDIKSMGPVNIEGIGPMNIKTKGLINIDGGPGATDFVLTNPTTLSPFTGAPLVPFSTTVKVSK